MSNCENSYCYIHRAGNRESRRYLIEKLKLVRNLYKLIKVKQNSEIEFKESQLIRK